MCRGAVGDVDAACDVETLQRANAEVFHRDLQELVGTTFMRLFKVDLSSACALDSAGDDRGGAGAAGAVGGGGPRGAGEGEGGQGDGDDPEMCAGSMSMPDGAPPPCEVETFTFGGAGGFGGSDFGQSVTDVPAISTVDRTLSDFEKGALPGARGGGGGDGPPCGEDEPEFWLDMCSAIPVDTEEFVNLQLNPEGWTGYDGSAVWAKIYGDQCFATPPGRGAEAIPCYEDRVMFRLLSGMHASINVAVAEAYHPPVRGKREGWEPNPDHFFRQYSGENAGYLKNMHFAFLVMLRAMRKAAPALRAFDYGLGGGGGQLHGRLRR